VTTSIDPRIKPVIGRLGALLEERGFRAWDIGAEELPGWIKSEYGLARLHAEVFRGKEISIQIRFSLGENRIGGLVLHRSVTLRWPRAEEMLRELWPEFSDTEEQLLRGKGATDKAIQRSRDQRAELRPIVWLMMADSDLTVFTPERALNSPLLAQAVNAVVTEVIPKYSTYCDIERLVSAVLEPPNLREFYANPVDAATILVAAGKRREFFAWRDDFIHLRKNWKPPPPEMETHLREEQEYITALSKRLPP
jgi:hypothetical protein